MFANTYSKKQTKVWENSNAIINGEKSKLGAELLEDIFLHGYSIEPKRNGNFCIKQFDTIIELESKSLAKALRAYFKEHTALMMENIKDDIHEAFVHDAWYTENDKVFALDLCGDIGYNINGQSITFTVLGSSYNWHFTRHTWVSDLSFDQKTKKLQHA